MSTPFGLGQSRQDATTDIPASTLRKLASMGFERVAGNQFVCQSTKEFWQVKGNKLVRLVGNEVDAGDRLTAPKDDNPAEFLESILGDLTF